MIDRVVNLTPHDVVIVADDGSEQTLVFPRSGIVARAVEKKSKAAALSDDMSVGVLRVHYEGLENLPSPEEGTKFIVSVLTVLAARAVGRTTEDLYYPGSLVRDIGGNVIGCEALYQLA